MVSFSTILDGSARLLGLIVLGGLRFVSARLAGGRPNSGRPRKLELSRIVYFICRRRTPRKEREFFSLFSRVEGNEF